MIFFPYYITTKNKKFCRTILAFLDIFIWLDLSLSTMLAESFLQDCRFPIAHARTRFWSKRYVLIFQNGFRALPSKACMSISFNQTKLKCCFFFIMRSKHSALLSRCAFWVFQITSDVIIRTSYQIGTKDRFRPETLSTQVLKHL